MKEIKKISIKEFCKQYKSRLPQLQDTYLKENLVITKYVPFNKKNVLAEKLVDISTYAFEDYIKEDGTMGRIKTDRIHVNSTIQYLLFCRLVIENYTNLTVETEGFFEEYDALKECGLLDKLMVSTETRTSLIPVDEITELRALIDFKQKDAIFNTTEIHNYVSLQVERFGNLFGISLNPIMEKIANSLENMEEKDIDKLVNKFDKVLKRVK